jgi:hypothetical protein
LPPGCGLVTTIGDQYQMYFWIDLFDPTTNIQKVFAINWITVVATKGDFLNLFNNGSANLIFKKIQRKLTI